MTTAAAIIDELNARGVTLQAHGDALRFRPRERVTPALLQRLRDHKPALLALLTGNSGDGDETLKGPESGRVVSPAEANDLEPHDHGDAPSWQPYTTADGRHGRQRADVADLEVIDNRNQCEFHAYANIFPMLPDKELRQLATDIEANGLKEPGMLFQGRVLDGRSRYRACQMAGVEMRWEQVDDEEHFDALGHVLSKNLHRRHLNQSQRALAAAKARELFDKRAKQRMLSGKKDPVENPPQGNGKARDQAGAVFGANGRYVDLATKLLKSGNHDLIADVANGKVTIESATRQLKRAETRKSREESASTRTGDCGVLLGDFRKLAAQIQDGSLDLVLTDPPYDAESVSLYGDLGAFGAAKLVTR